jgi:hypothetical protein
MTTLNSRETTGITGIKVEAYQFESLTKLAEDFYQDMERYKRGEIYED